MFTYWFPLPILFVLCLTTFAKDDTFKVSPEFKSYGPVVHLTDANFYDIVNETPTSLVMFYFPGCMECEKTKPDFGRAAKHLAEKPEDEKEGKMIGAINCKEEIKVCSDFDVQEMPSFRLLHWGTLFKEHFGTKTKIGFFNAVKDAAKKVPSKPSPPASTPPPDPESKQIKSMRFWDLDNLERHIEALDGLLVLYYKSAEDAHEKLKPAYEKAAAEVSETQSIVSVDCSDTPSICQAKDIRSFPTMHMFVKGDFYKDYDGKWRADDIREAVEEIYTDLRLRNKDMEFDEMVVTDEFEYYDRLEKYNIAIVMFFAPWCPHCKTVKPFMAETGTLLRKNGLNKQFWLAAVDCTQTEEFCEMQAITGYPTFRIYKDGEFIEHMKGPRSVQGFLQNFNDHKEGMRNGVPIQKENMPTAGEADDTASLEGEDESQLDERFKSLVVKPSFIKKALSKSSHSVVLFFGRHCDEYCTSIKRSFAAASAQVLPGTKYENQFIGAIDCSKHAKYCESVNVMRTPKINLYIGQKVAKTYDGEVTPEILLMFLAPEDALQDLKPQKTDSSGDKTKEESTNELPGSTMDEFDIYVDLLNTANFKTKLEKASPALVMFYAPWCDKSMAAKPELVHVARAVVRDEDKSDWLVGRVDCVTETDLCKSKGVKDYPTLQLYSHGNYVGTLKEKMDGDGIIRKMGAVKPEKKDAGKTEL